MRREYGDNKNRALGAFTGVILSMLIVLWIVPEIFVFAKTSTVTGTITAKNILQEGVRVTAYQLAAGVYTEEGKLIGYTLTDLAAPYVKDMTAPTSQEISDIIQVIHGESDGVEIIEIPMSEALGEEGTYSAEAEPGEYLILVEDSAEIVYNPAVVSVNITDANTIDESTITQGSVDFEEGFTISDTAYMKSSYSSISSTVAKEDAEKKAGVTAAVGDTLTFYLENMIIPSYSDSYVLVRYEVSDVLEEGNFASIQNLQIFVGGEEVEENDENYTLTWSTDTAFTVSFTDTFIRTHALSDVEITYTTSLLDSADLNFAENLSTATLQYTVDAEDADVVNTISVSNYVYSFGLGSNIDGEAADETDQTQTYELNKVTADGGTYVQVLLDDDTALSANGAYNTKASEFALEGAEFILYSDYEDGTLSGEIATAVSDVNGHLTFTGLDVGSYYLQESAAAKGYSLNNAIYRVTIEASLSEDGILSAFSVNTADISGETEQLSGSASYSCDVAFSESGAGLVRSDYDLTITPAEIVNTVIPLLPSTGGSGVYVFWIAAGIMAAGFVLFETICVLRRKRH